jgi:hypothetical protein
MLTEKIYKAIQEDAVLAARLAELTSRHPDPMAVEFISDLFDMLIDVGGKKNEAALCTLAFMSHEVLQRFADTPFILAVGKEAKEALKRAWEFKIQRDKVMALVARLDAHVEGHVVLPEPEIIKILVELKGTPNVQFDKLDESLSQPVGWAASMVAKA